MADKASAQTGLVVKLGFEREDTEHQIDRASHMNDAPAMPRPDLRADVVNDFLSAFSTTQCSGQAQIKTGIIDEQDGGWINVIDLVQRLAKFPAEIAILFQDFPQSKNAGIRDPIIERFVCQCLHLRAAPADELEIRFKGPQGVHDGGAVIISARLTGDEVNGLRHHGGCRTTALEFNSLGGKGSQATDIQNQ